MTQKKKQLLSSLIITHLLFGVPSLVFAETSSDEPDPAFEMEEYVITANRIPVKITETAANVTVITQEQIEQGNFSTVPDILRKNNINIEEDSSGSQPIINGDSRVLVLVDGRRMNWDQIVKSGSKGVNLNNLNVENIERIEVVRGPSSSLYGSDAAGGVINIITRKATKASTSVKTEFGSWGTQRYSITTGDKTDNGFSYFVTAGKEKRGNYRYKDAKTNSNRTFTQTSYDENSLTMRLDQDLDNDRSISFYFDHNDRDGDFTFAAPGYTSYYPNGHTKSNNDNIALTYNYGKNNLVQIYQNHASNDTYRDETSSYSIDRKEQGFNWQNSFKLNERHTLTTGTDYRKDKFDYPSQGIQKTYNSKAIFIEDLWKLSDDWNMTLGTRYDNHSFIGGHQTSRVTVNHQLDQKSNVYLSWGQFIKAPLIEDLYSNTEFMIGNPNLKPESGDTVTLGLNTTLGNGTKLQASVFSSRLDNAINYIYGGALTRVDNIDHQKRKGADLTLSQQLSPKWNVSGGYSYVSIKNKAANAADYINDINNNQPNFYHLGLQYTQDKFSSDITLRHISGRSTQTFSSSAYTTLDLNLNYQMTPDSRLFMKGYNLTNEGYEIRSGGKLKNIGAYPMPGRSFYVGLEQKL